MLKHAKWSQNQWIPKKEFYDFDPPKCIIEAGFVIYKDKEKENILSRTKIYLKV